MQLLGITHQCRAPSPMLKCRHRTGNLSASSLLLHLNYVAVPACRLVDVRLILIFTFTVSVITIFLSPLSCGVVDLIALAATYCDGVKRLEGAQTYTRDGHPVGGKHDQDRLGVVEGHRKVVVDGDHQRVVTAAETPLACRMDGELNKLC